MNSPASPLLPRLHLWLTVILMPAMPEYEQRHASLSKLIADLKAEKLELLAQLESATSEHLRTGLHTALKDLNKELAGYQDRLQHLETVHRERN